MFLDDQLYKEVINSDINSPEDYQSLVNRLWAICQTKIEEVLVGCVGLSYVVSTRELDRVFNSWDLFIKRLKKEKWFLIDVLEEHAFKDEYLKNEKIKEIYLMGK